MFGGGIMKPFRNAYEAIKRLLSKLFGGGEEKEETTGVAEPEVKKPEPQPEPEPKKPETKPENKKAEPKKPEANKKPEPKKPEANKKPEAKPENKKAEPKKQGAKPENKTAEPKKSASGKTAEEDMEAYVRESERKEQEAYAAEAKRRAERAAKREAEEKRAEQRAARREMEAQAGMGVRRVTDPVTGEEVPLGALPARAVTLKKYSKIASTSDDVILSVNSILRHPDMSKNIVILGKNGFGTVRVGEDFARSFYAMELVKSDKIAKIKAKQLNKIGLEKLQSLKGGCLIIENAGLVAPAKLVEVIKNSAPDENDYVVILTGEIDSLARFFEDNQDVADQFIYLVGIHKIKEKGMISLARGYIKEKGYTADKPVYEQLKQSLTSMEEGNIDRCLEFLDKVMEATDAREVSEGNGGHKEVLVEDVRKA